MPCFLDRAREIAGIAREHAQQTEAARRVGDDMIARMREADLFRIMQPQAYGGFEYGFEVFAEVEATLASGCGSTGWVYGLLASHQWLIACFGEAAQDESGAIAAALAAGTYAPVAQAVAADGGYRVSGSGSFCSGCDNAQWQFLGGMIPQAGGPPQPGFFLLRTADITIDDDWRTMGLAGTGSKTIVADNAFVPCSPRAGLRRTGERHRAWHAGCTPTRCTSNRSWPCCRSPSWRRCSAWRKARWRCFSTWSRSAPRAAR